jgi:16S rRNA C1402 N4-methylase RsmH
MIDGTFGGGNHSVPLLDKHPELKVLGTDLDNSTLGQCREKYSSYIKKRRLALEHMNFVNGIYVDPKEAFRS